MPRERGYEWSILWPGLRGVEEGAEPELSNRRGEGDRASEASFQRFPEFGRPEKVVSGQDSGEPDTPNS